MEGCWIASQHVYGSIPGKVFGMVWGRFGKVLQGFLSVGADWVEKVPWPTAPEGSGLLPLAFNASEGRA